MTGEEKHTREREKNHLWNLLQAPTYRKTCVRRESEQCRQQRGVQGHLKCGYENSHDLEVTDPQNVVFMARYLFRVWQTHAHLASVSICTLILLPCHVFTEDYKH